METRSWEVSVVAADTCCNDTMLLLHYADPGKGPCVLMGINGTSEKLFEMRSNIPSKWLIE